eukprot:11182563-Lingulodinium_polyedra.AAC.1
MRVVEHGVLVGPCDDAQLNDSGLRLIRFLEASGLCAASKWWPVGYAWRSSKGAVALFDYVL